MVDKREEKGGKIPKTHEQASPSSSRSTSLSSSSSQIPCAICLSYVRGQDGKVILNCRHSFHAHCLKSNLKRGNQSCPLCRDEVKVASKNPFQDDECLVHGGTEIQSLGGDQAVVDIDLFSETSAAAKLDVHKNFAAMINVRAKRSVEYSAPLDLVLVLDVSGSMEGEKLYLMKAAVCNVIRILKENDRLSVIAFSSDATRLFPLTIMSDTSKTRTTEMVNSLNASGGTNIARGLKLGVEVIAGRRWKNYVTGIILLSDGQDNFTMAYGGFRTREDYDALVPSRCQIPVHTFGLGSDHDAELMYAISQVSSGTFTFVETEALIQVAFERCVKGLLSVVALEQIVRIECAQLEGLKISSILAGCYKISVARDGRSATIDVGDMYAEEERNFLVILDIPSCDNGSAEPESMPLLKVRCDYKDPFTNEDLHVLSGELGIQRPMVLTGEELVSVEVDRQRNRFLVSEAMFEAQRLADAGKMSEGVKLLGNCKSELLKTASARSNDIVCQELSSELEAMQQRLIRWGFYDKKGRAFLFSCLSSHTTQRATAAACGNSTKSYSLVHGYKTAPVAPTVTRDTHLVLRTPNIPAPPPDEWNLL